MGSTHSTGKCGVIAFIDRLNGSSIVLREWVGARAGVIAVMGRLNKSAAVPCERAGSAAAAIGREVVKRQETLRLK